MNTPCTSAPRYNAEMRRKWQKHGELLKSIGFTEVNPRKGQAEDEKFYTHRNLPEGINLRFDTPCSTVGHVLWVAFKRGETAGQIGVQRVINEALGHFR